MNMMQSRLESSEQRQNQMIQFLSKALQHPELIHQLAGARQRISHNGKRGSGLFVFLQRCPFLQATCQSHSPFPILGSRQRTGTASCAFTEKDRFVVRQTQAADV
jgi:hypothetical protein